MKKFKLILLILSIIILTTACWSRREIENLGFIIGIGISKTDQDLYSVTVQVANAAALSSKEPDPRSIYTIIKSEGLTAFDALRNMSMVAGRRLYLAHVKVLIIDEEVFTKEGVYNLGIEVGDIISFDTRTKITKSGFVKSRYLDDKASVAAILYTMKYMNLNNIQPNNTINFFFSNYEEVGHGSSAFIPQNTSEFIAVDMGCPGEGQNSTEYDACICTKDSNGPYDYEFISKLVDICKRNNISYKLDIYPNYGSDATAALKSGMDAKFALIGPGVFASHGYERTHISSIIETEKLIISYIK